MKRFLGIGKEEKVVAVKDKIVAPFGTAEFLKEIKEMKDKKERDAEITDEIKIIEDDMYGSVIRYDEINDTMCKLKCEKDIIEHTIMSKMLYHDTAYIKERKISWKKTPRTSIDSKRLKEEEPGIYEKYCRVSHSWIFKIK